MTIKWIVRIFCILSFFALHSKENAIVRKVQEIDKIDDVVHFYSFRHSGTNLMATLLTRLTQRQCLLYNHHATYNTNWNRLLLPINRDLPSIYVSHNPIYRKWIKNPTHSLIVIVRNYKSVALRNDVPLKKILGFLKGNQKLGANGHPFLHYINILKTYDLWPEDKRILIYFEDLMSNPEPELKKLAQFFGKSTEETEAFIQDYPVLSQEILNNFISRHRYANTPTKGVDFYDRQIPLKNHKEIDAFLRNLYPTLWHKYMSRYEFGGSSKYAFD